MGGVDDKVFEKSNQPIKRIYIFGMFLIQIFMEKINIGYNAGTVLQKLGETGFVAIAELARKLNLGADDTALAAGWLAREGKVRIERKNGVLYVANQA